MECLKVSYIDDVYNFVDVYHKRKYQCRKAESIFYTKIHEEDEYFLAEKRLYPSPILVDLDFRKESETVCKLYEEENLINVFDKHVKVIRNETDISESETIVAMVLEKSPRKESGTIKDGFHLHFPFLTMNKSGLNELFKRLEKDIEGLDNVSSNPWMMYGASKKPGAEPFLITRALVSKPGSPTMIVDEWQDYFIGIEISGEYITSDNLDSFLPYIMSVRCGQVFKFQKMLKFKNDFNVKDNNKMFKMDKNSPVDSKDLVDPIEEMEDELDYENSEDVVLGYKNYDENDYHLGLNGFSILEINKMLMQLKTERAENFDDWVKVCMILVDEGKKRDQKEDFKACFHNFSETGNNYNRHSCDDKFEELWARPLVKGGVTLGSLIQMVKVDTGKNRIKKILRDSDDEMEDLIPVDDFDIAEIIMESMKDTQLFMYNERYGVYQFDKTIWVEKDSWKSSFRNKIVAWYRANSHIYKKKVNDILDSCKDEKQGDRLCKMLRGGLITLRKKCKNYPSSGVIANCMANVVLNDEFKILFTQKNKLLAFNNVTFDVEQWKIIQGDPAHMLSCRVKHDFVRWDDLDNDIGKAFVIDFFEKLFTDEGNRNFMIDNFARLLTGSNYHKQFHFWNGIGNNGKSICVKMIDEVFGRMAVRVPKSLVLGQQQQKGSATPETCKLKNSRMAIIDEVTNMDYLDPGQIKGLSGNDKIYCRELYQSGTDAEEVDPMFLPVIITNETPYITKADDATWNRVRLIRFNSIFKSDPEAYIRDHPDCDPTKVFKCDPLLTDKLRKYAQVFLAYFMKHLENFKDEEEFNADENVPNEAVEGLVDFKRKQNIMKRYFEENFILCEDEKTGILLQTLAKEFNAKNQKIGLDLSHVRESVMSYVSLHPKLKIIGDRVFGLIRAE